MFAARLPVLPGIALIGGPLSDPLAETSRLGHVLSLWTVAPFALLLLGIAILPLTHAHWWESNKNRAIVSATLAVPFAAYLYFVQGSAGVHALVEVSVDYFAFVSFLFALYVISGGIYIKGSLAGSPLANSTLLGIGAVLANLIGTTGASMVLIRPLLRANVTRAKKVHIVVFFIFVVSNCGGLLTPLGDPPLFLGFLKGVPFAWTFDLWQEWAIVNGFLLAVFFIVDSYVLSEEELERPGPQLEDALKHEPIGVLGGLNLVFLFGVVGVVIAKSRGLGAESGHWPFGVQESLMLGLAGASYFSTRRQVHAANNFTFAPIVEVAVLFAGIFITMVAPLAILNARGAELGIEEPWQYFWATGLLSSVLDNAPTYLSLASTACGQAGVPTDGPHYLADFLARGPRSSETLAAISCGAVMMGANTYIGNGPNFMVKSIAEASGVKMPSFFGYVLWSLFVLIPIFGVVTWLFFR